MPDRTVKDLSFYKNPRYLKLLCKAAKVDGVQVDIEEPFENTVVSDDLLRFLISRKSQYANDLRALLDGNTLPLFDSSPEACIRVLSTSADTLRKSIAAQQVVVEELESMLAMLELNRRKS